MAERAASSTSRMLLCAAFNWFILRKCRGALLAPILIAVLALSCGIIQTVAWRLLLRRQLSPLKSLPGPKDSNLLLGNFKAIFDEPIGSQIFQWAENIRNNGLLHFRGLLGSEYLILTSIESMADVMSRHAYDFEKPSAFRNYSRRFIGQGLGVDEGDAHRQHRRLMSPVFIERRITDLKPLLSSKASQFSRRIFCGSKNDNKTMDVGNSQGIDISYWASRIALDTVCIVALGIDLEIISDDNNELFAAYQTTFSCSEGKKGQFMWHNCAPKWLTRLFPSKIDYEMDLAIKSMRSIMRKIVQDRFDQGKNANEKLIGTNLLSQLIVSGNFSIDECVDQVLFLLAAGHESTANSIRWILVELALHPNLQDELRQELQNQDDECSFDDLPFLNAICNEAIRLHPTVAMSIRKSIRDTTIQDQVVLVGTYIVITPEVVNKSRKYWGDNASEFYPRRWLKRTEQGLGFDPMGGAPSNHCTQSFLQGPRGCIGRSLAMAEIRRVIAVLVQDFKIETPEKTVPEAVGFITVKPKEGFYLQLVPISQ